jgi:hypothetical protein
MNTNDNHLRDENGALIGGLNVMEYMEGMDDFNARRPPSPLTSPSYDLGRLRAAEKAERMSEVKAWLDRQERERIARMKEILSPRAFAEFEAKMREIRARPKT